MLDVVRESRVNTPIPAIRGHRSVGGTYAAS